MVSPLEGSIAATIGKAFDKISYACTVARISTGSGAAHKPGAGTATDYACKGMIDQFSTREIDGTLIRLGDVKVLILATSLATEPKPGDKVMIRGETYNVCEPIRTDPAKAVWELIGRA